MTRRVTNRCAIGSASPLADRAGYVPRAHRATPRPARCRDDIAPPSANSTSDPGLDWYLWTAEGRPLPARVRPDFGACARRSQP